MFGRDLFTLAVVTYLARAWSYPWTRPSPRMLPCQKMVTPC